ncbi:MAG: FG-GAP repeat protein, partial [Myxococcota bacterium]
HRPLDDAYLANTIAMSPDGVVALGSAGHRGGRGQVWLLSAAKPCQGERVIIPDDVVVTVEGSDTDRYFGNTAVWIPDFTGAGTAALAINANFTGAGGVERGAIYIWESPLEGEGSLISEDADLIVIGDSDGSRLTRLAPAIAMSGETDLILTQTATSSGGLVVGRVPAGFSSGTLSEVSIGGIMSESTDRAATAEVIGDANRSGEASIVAGVWTPGMWSLSDLEGFVEEKDAQITFDWSLEGEWLTRIVPAGDMDYDGRNDLLLLAEDWPSTREQGRIGLLIADELNEFGLNDLENVRFIASGESPGDSFGYLAIPVGDFDRDGRQDIAVSAYGTDSSGASTGSVYLLPSPWRMPE